MAPGAGAPVMECRELASPPPPGSERRSKADCLGDLLAAIAALTTVLQQEDDDGTPRLRPRTSTAAASHAWENGEARTAREDASFSSTCDTALAESDLPPTALFPDRELKKLLPFVREFTAVGGDWQAFHRRFITACRLAEWTEEEALRALPTVLDDEALAALDAIPNKEKEDDAGPSPGADRGDFCSSLRQASQVHHA
ncbi:unnamed protein product [Lampetra planeri]